MKGAFLIHGWATDRHVWHRYWILDREAPMLDMLRKNGYEPLPVELPGNYLERDKDFTWYGRYLGHLIREREEFDEVIIIGFSMGGIVARTYITLKDELFREGVDRVKMIISLGTPNHGTSVPQFDLLSRFLTTLADYVLPWGPDLIEGDEHNYFMTTPCYRDIQMGSKYLLELNKRTVPPHVKNHVVWTNGDTVADPQHTCILPGAKNHLVDKVSVNHFNMCYREEIVETVEKIINGRQEEKGLQDHPPIQGCTHREGHLWLPDTSLVNRDGINIWRCSVCSAVDVSHALPAQITCRNGKGRPSIHKWKREKKVYRYRFRCGRCGVSKWYPDIDGYTSS